MFDHVGIRVSDRAESERFYGTVLAVLGLEADRSEHCTEWGDLAIGDDGPPTQHLHVGFYAESRAQVDAFWQAGVDAGYRSDGEPGPRPQYTPEYYGAFLLDPDGNSIEAVNLANDRDAGAIDHLWIRVADVERTAAFYDIIAPAVGLQRGPGFPGTAHFRATRSTFSLVPSETPTRNLHLAFPGSREQVHAFHEAALAAGYRDNGAPGERAQYHPGYYAAFVLDPDATNVEIVDHGRGG